MTVTDDDRFEMAPTLCEESAEAFLAVGLVPYGFEPVAGLLEELRALAEGAAPRPSAALQTLLAGAGPAEVLDLATRRAGRLAGLGVTAALVGLVTLGSAGVAAANGRLPRATQDAVADAIEAVTPFTVPHHRLEDRDAPPAASAPGPVAGVPRAVVVVPAARPLSSARHIAKVAGTPATGRGAAQVRHSAGDRDAAETGHDSTGSGGTARGAATHGSGDSGSGDSGSGGGASGGGGSGSAAHESVDSSGSSSGSSDGSAGSGSSASSDGGGGSGSGGSSGGSGGPESVDVDHSGNGG